VRNYAGVHCVHLETAVLQQAGLQHGHPLQLGLAELVGFELGQDVPELYPEAVDVFIR
jgi:hypothetical protein